MTPPATSKLHVADLMTIDPIVVSVDATIEEAEEQLRYHRVTGLPVVDLSGRLVGVISQTDLLYLAVPTVQALIRHRSSGIRVGEVMSRPAVTVSIATPLSSAARTMIDNRVHRVVVVDDQYRPIGVLSAMDFVELYADD